MAVIQASKLPVFVTKNISKEINNFFKSRKNAYSKVFILVDENTIHYCYPPLAAKIPAFKDAEIIEIESGEESKNIEVCSQIWSTLSEYGADRNSLIVNLGGGVICDMGGFIASTFKRGVDFINIPTTLLAQADASFGGKTGIDHNHLKNEIGVFNFPEAVFINSDFLHTLSKRQFQSGFAEIIKHGLIADAKYWEKIKTFKSGQAGIDKLIEASIAIKNKLVQEDPLDKNVRKKLNFGHTVAHALETYFLESGREILHGEAVAIGMICESYLSHKASKLSQKQLTEITRFIIERYKPIKAGERIDSEQLILHMKHDKKNSNEGINFSLLSAIGKCEINKIIKKDLIIEALNYYHKEANILNK